MVGKKLLHLTSGRSVIAPVGHILFVALAVFLLAATGRAEIGKEWVEDGPKY